MNKRRNLSGPEKKRVAASGGWKCGKCESLLPSNFEIDHKIPLWKGGIDGAPNLWALCSSCHSIKTEDETIERIKNKHKTLAFLECNKCDAKLSPFFIHKCQEKNVC